MMDLKDISTELNNKNIKTIFQKGSTSYLKYGPQFIGRLVGRTLGKTSDFKKNVLSLTILAQNYIAYQIPTEDILFISELCV